MQDWQKWFVVLGLAIVGAAIYTNSVQVKKALDSVVAPLASNL